MYKVTIIDKSSMEWDDILIADKKSLNALMDFAWRPCRVNYTTVYDYTDIDSIKGYEVVAGIFGEEENTLIHIYVKDAYSAGAITAYFMNNAHFKSGDEVCAKPVGEGDE